METPKSVQAQGQIVARAVRHCSHKFLPWPWTVRVHRYIARSSSDAHMSDDLILQKSESDHSEVKQVLDVIASSSIEHGYNGCAQHTGVAQMKGCGTEAGQEIKASPSIATRKGTPFARPNGAVNTEGVEDAYKVQQEDVSSLPNAQPDALPPRALSEAAPKSSRWSQWARFSRLASRFGKRGQAVSHGPQSAVQPPNPATGSVDPAEAHEAHEANGEYAAAPGHAGENGAGTFPRLERLLARNSSNDHDHLIRTRRVTENADSSASTSKLSTSVPATIAPATAVPETVAPETVAPTRVVDSSAAVSMSGPNNGQLARAGPLPVGRGLYRPKQVAIDDLVSMLSSPSARIRD